MNNEYRSAGRSEVLRDIFYQGWNICITSNHRYQTVTISPSPEIQDHLWYRGYGDYANTIRRTIEHIVERPVYVEQVTNFLHTDRISFQYSYNGFEDMDMSYQDCTYKDYELDTILSHALYAIHFINTSSGGLSESVLMDILHNNKDDEVTADINKDEFFMILEKRSRVEGEELLFES